jgi:hypothetical protein
VVGKVCAPFGRGLDDADDVFHLCVVGGLVVEPGRDAPGAFLETGDDDLLHLHDVIGGRRSIGQPLHLRPRGIEADVAPEIDRQTLAVVPRQLIAQVGRAAAVGIDDFARHSLRQHVLGSRHGRLRGMTVDVDEARRDEEPRHIELEGRVLFRQIADAGDGAAGDRDVGPDSRQTRSIEHRAVAQDDVEPRGRRRLRRGRHAVKEKKQTGA